MTSTRSFAALLAGLLSLSACGTPSGVVGPMCSGLRGPAISLPKCFAESRDGEACPEDGPKPEPAIVVAEEKQSPPSGGCR
jgi:hypothetical protein